MKILFIFPFLVAFIMVGVGTVLNNWEVVQVAAQETLIIIDAGHGGIDPGTVSGQILEKEINLDVAKKVKNQLEQKGINAILTRDSDLHAPDTKATTRNRQLASLMGRVNLANKHQAKGLVSIHVNSSKNKQHFGPQTYYRKGAVNGLKLAEKIQQELVKIRISKRRAIEGDYYLLHNSQVPAVIVELGFISNEEDKQLLLQESYRRLLAEAIAKAIYYFLKGD